MAIVGPSGCGKSTLLGILLGILKPTDGAVLVGGVDLQYLGVKALRKIIGSVSQDDSLFAGSIAENISFFDHNTDQAKVEECARMSAIHDDIIAMPMGYRTLVGDMRTVLSGGQKQRILIARALYREPKILIFDEATSYLDPECETRVVTAIRALKVTRIFVSHRPQTIDTADRVIDINPDRSRSTMYSGKATLDYLQDGRSVDEDFDEGLSAGGDEI